MATETEGEIAERAMALKQAGKELHPDGFERVRVRILPDGRMRREEAAKYLGKELKTLANWYTHGKGPRSVLVGGQRFYFQDDLDAWIATQAVEMTLEAGETIAEVRVFPDGRMSINDAARYVGCTPRTLARWRTEGRGPKFRRVAGRIFYTRQALDKFMGGATAAE